MLFFFSICAIAQLVNSAHNTAVPKTTHPHATLGGLSDPALDEVASFFQALAEPNRLRLLNLLRGGEQRVGDLAELSGMTTTNVSRHLSLLQQRGLVLREGRGTSVYYRIADAGIYELCDLVCGSLARQSEASAKERLAAVQALKPPAAGLTSAIKATTSASRSDSISRSAPTSNPPATRGLARSWRARA